METNQEVFTPHDLIKRHIENKDHVVTDEELQKVKVGWEAESAEAARKETKLRSQDLQTNNKFPNPYNIL
jgi:hypothetical protein